MPAKRKVLVEFDLPRDLSLTRLPKAVDRQ